MKLVDVLKPEYIQIPLNGNSKEHVIKELIEILASHGIFEDSDAVFQAVMEREKIMTTGVGRSVAIPHCKKDECKEFAIALGLNTEGVDFHSIDQQPVRIVFLLVGPEDNPGIHIRLLSRVSRLISKDSLRDALLKCETPRQAYDLLKKEEEEYFEMAS
jgi:PTS system fructose-specific IIC component